MKYLIILSCTIIFLNSCSSSKKLNRIIEEPGYLLSIRNNFYYIPNTNIKNIDSLNGMTVYSLYEIRDNILNESINQRLKKKSIVLLEETDPPNIRVIDTLYYGYVTLYYKKDKLLISRDATPSKIEYDYLDSTRMSFIIKEKYPANVYFMTLKSDSIIIPF